MPRDRLVVVILLVLVLLICGGLVFFPLLNESTDNSDISRIEEDGLDSFRTQISVIFGGGDSAIESMRSQLALSSRRIPDLEGLTAERDTLKAMLSDQSERYESPDSNDSFLFGNDLINELERFSIDILRYRPIPGEELRLECVLRGEVYSVLSFIEAIESNYIYQRIVYASLKETETGILEGEVEIVRLYAN